MKAALIHGIQHCLDGGADDFPVPLVQLFQHAEELFLFPVRYLQLRVEDRIAGDVQHICQTEQVIETWTSLFSFQGNEETGRYADFFGDLFLCLSGCEAVFLKYGTQVGNIQLFLFFHCQFTSNIIVPFRLWFENVLAVHEKQEHFIQEKEGWLKESAKGKAAKNTEEKERGIMRIKRGIQICGSAVLGIALLFSGIKVQAFCAEDRGVVTAEAQMYAAADDEADRLGKIAEGTEVEVVSILSEFVLIKESGRYAYIPRRALSMNADYSRLYGQKKPCSSAEPMLIVEGNLYENAVPLLLQAYGMIPEKIRTAFERDGFRIKMTEWDVAQEAYEPYGGYRGIGRIKAVTDYERKMIYINDEWPNAIIHEMGHYVNDSLGMYSSRPENLELFRREAGKISLYAQSNDREYFAEAFRLYITEPMLLWMISPKSFEMIDKTL